MAEDDDRYTVDAVRKWDFDNTRSAIKNFASRSANIQREADTTAREYDTSTDYWEGTGGQAARNLSMMHKSDLSRSVAVIATIAEQAGSALDALQGEVDVIRRKVAEVKASEYELAYNPDGGVYSRKSNREWADEWGWKAPLKLAEKEGQEKGLTAALRGALARLESLDTSRGEGIRGVLEKLADAVKEGAAPKPTDERLAKILRDYQTKPSAGQATLWPDGKLLSMIRTVHPGFNPRLMTPEEVKLVAAMVASRGNVISQVQAAKKWYDAMSTADQVAKQKFPGLGLNDGHGDAFRHAYWNALMTKEFGADWTAQYATAHEGLGGNPASREAMDLYNNEIGRAIASANPDASDEELAGLVENAVKSGETVVVDDHLSIDWSNRVGVGDTGKPGTVGIPLPSH